MIVFSLFLLIFYHKINYLIPNKREWNNCFNKNHQEILSGLADFALHEQPEENFMVTISQIPWPLSQSNPWNCIMQRSSF